MKEKTLKEHLHSIQSKGGKALVKKRGKKYMADLVKKRWAKKKVDKDEK